MTVTIFINYLNHHQVSVADELYKLLGDNFHFVATYPKSQDQMKGGRDYSDRPYALFPCENEKDLLIAHGLVLDSDVCLFGAGNLDWEKLRVKTNKFSFEISERWLKRGWINIFSPRLLKWWWLYHTQLRHRHFYKLCASAYTAADCHKLFTFSGKCFKWGYFTHGQHDAEGTPCLTSEKIRIIWVARFIPLKHPEAAIYAAKKLADEGYDFVLDMYGDGPLKKKIETRIEKYGLVGKVNLMGNVPNDQIHSAMRNSDVLLFTSDRKEGWGAVVNEAMSNGCCIVANREIGSVPFMVNDNSNGLTYKNGDLEDLTQCIRVLLAAPAACREMGMQAHRDFNRLWTPYVAARNLLTLINDLMAGKPTSIKEGPCSNA